NQKDVEEINPDYLKELEIHFVTKMSEVLQLALEPKKYKNARRLVPAKKEPQEPTTDNTRIEQIRKIVARA
ncbi:MAG: hypothetical protein KDD63_09105, partial [Bacteroidetes bacterium]|nr:hypothetical protein [Bacteroidota bacterium]